MCFVDHHPHVHRVAGRRGVDLGREDTIAHDGHTEIGPRHELLEDHRGVAYGVQGGQVLRPYEPGLAPGVGRGDEGLEYGAADAALLDEPAGLLRLIGDQGARQREPDAARHFPLVGLVVGDPVQRGRIDPGAVERVEQAVQCLAGLADREALVPGGAQLPVDGEGTHAPPPCHAAPVEAGVGRRRRERMDRPPATA